MHISRRVVHVRQQERMPEALFRAGIPSGVSAVPVILRAIRFHPHFRLSSGGPDFALCNRNFRVERRDPGTTDDGAPLSAKAQILFPPEVQLPTRPGWFNVTASVSTMDGKFTVVIDRFIPEDDPLPELEASAFYGELQLV